MKISYWFMFLFLLNTAVNGQDPCGTVLHDDMRASLLEYHARKAELGTSGTRVTRFVPLKFHIVGRSNGTGYYRKANLWTLLCELNTKFAPTGFYFYLYGSINYINSSEYFDLDFSSGNQMMYQNNVDGVTNVYIVNDPAGYCGYYTYGPDALTVAKNCNKPGSTTLAHELGHYFSLPHPFDIVGSQEEYVNGSNCQVGGDMFCDTRADFLDYRWSCPYTGNETDPNGDFYNPDSTLFMSYSFDECQEKFSFEQMDAMNYNLTFNRTDLLNHPAPDISPITGTPVLTLPVDSANDIPHDFVQFKWEPVPGAEYYHVEVTRAPTFGAEPTETDVLVYGTAFTTALEVDKTYKWRVLGLKNGYTCGNWSEPEVFITVLGTGMEAVNQAASKFIIYPSLVTGGSRITASLSMSSESAGFLRIISADGRIVQERKLTADAGDNNWQIETDGMAAGVYQVQLLCHNTIYSSKLVVSR